MSQYFRNIYATVYTILVGMRITLRYFFARTVTLQYPDLPPTNQPRYRGFHYYEIEKCIACDMCAKACPVDCIYEGEDQYYIHPEECIDCGACEPECPVQAIFPDTDVPPEWTSFIVKNVDFFE